MDDFNDLDLNINIENYDVPEMSDQQIDDILGTEYVADNVDINTVEDQVQDLSPSADKLKAFKQKQAEAAKVKARKLAEERTRRASTAVNADYVDFGTYTERELEHEVNHEVEHEIEHEVECKTSSSYSGGSFFEYPVIFTYDQKHDEHYSITDFTYYENTHQYFEQPGISAYETPAYETNHATTDATLSYSEFSKTTDTFHNKSASQSQEHNEQHKYVSYDTDYNAMEDTVYHTELRQDKEFANIPTEHTSQAQESSYQPETDYTTSEQITLQEGSQREEVIKNESSVNRVYSAPGDTVKPSETAEHTYYESPSHETSHTVPENIIYQSESHEENPTLIDTPVWPISHETVHVVTEDMNDSHLGNQLIDIREIDTRNSYMIEPEVPSKGEFFEHTGNTIVKDSISRKIAGTITDSGVWEGCDIITDRSTDDGYAFNSRFEAAVIQPKEKPEEDESRLSTAIDKENVGNNIVFRKVSDIPVDGFVTDNAKMKTIDEEQAAVTIPDKADTSLLYSSSPDMDSSARYDGTETPIVNARIVSSNMDIHTVNSFFETAQASDTSKSDVKKASYNVSPAKDNALGTSLIGKNTTTEKSDDKLTEEQKINVSTETREAERSDARNIQAATKRKFIREGGKIWKDICSAGQVVEQAVVSNLGSDDDAAIDAFKKGKEKVRGLTNFIGFCGAKSTYEMIVNKATQVASIAGRVEKMITSGSLTLSDLSLSPKELRAAAETSELSSHHIELLVKNRNDIKQTLETKQIFLDFATNNSGKISDDLVNFLKGNEIFNNQLFSGEFTKISSAYFATSTNQLLKSINPANMTQKELRKLIDQADKMDVNGTDRKVLKELLRNKKACDSKAKNAYAHGAKGHLSQIGKVMNHFVKDLGEDATAVGARQLSSIFNGTKTAYRMLTLAGRTNTWTIKLAGKIVFLNPVSRYADRQIKKSLTVLKNTAKTKIQATETVKKITEITKNAVNVFNRNKKVQQVKQTAAKVKQKATAVKKTARKINNKRKSIGRAVKGFKNKAVNIIKKPFDIIFAPFNLFARLINKIKRFILQKIVLPLAGVLLAFVLIYIIMIVISGAAMSLVDSSQKAVFLSNEDMQSLVTYLYEKNDVIYEDALEKAQGTPINTKVYNGVEINCYGSPKSYDDATSEYYHHDVTIDKSLLNGWHIYYLNSNGDVINSTSNVKDIVCLASVMMSNNSDDLGEYENLVDDMWSGMAPYITSKESDIYHTEYSTDVYPKDGSIYYCNNGDFYKEYETAKNNGVFFYDSPVGQAITTPQVPGYICSGTGCCYREWYELVLDCSIEEHTHSDSCYSTDKKGQRHLTCTKSEHTHDSTCYKTVWYREYYCPGHSALHCSYGYRDINIYITLPSKDDVFKGVTNSEKTTFEYLIPYNFDGTSFDMRTVTMYYKTHLDGYRRRMDDFISNGFWDYSSHMKYATFDTTSRILTCDITKVGDDGSIHNGVPRDQRCSGAIEWCNSLYLSDWYTLYGITSIDGVGVKTSLTDDEISNYLAAIDEAYPSLSMNRYRMVNLALDQVGRINFWEGGKPEGPDWNAIWGQVASPSDFNYAYNNSYGRKIYGLDAFGFVGWCYWTNYGIEPDFTSFGFVDSLNLTRISSSNLLPGDIGLESIAGGIGNNIGIFAGYNENGDMLWIHCNDITGNVAVNNTNVFRYYYSIE